MTLTTGSTGMPRTAAGRGRAQTPATGTAASAGRAPGEGIRACRGQAMVEALLIVVLLSCLLFATLNICVMVVHDMISYEAAFSAARVAAVSRGDKSEIERRSQLAAAVLLARHVSPASYVPCETSTDFSTTAGFSYRSRGQAVFENTRLRYLSRVLFSSLFSPGYRTPAGNMQQREASAGMIRSPDEEYYDKAYHGAPEF